MRPYLSRAFTLIELLVVISVIGMMSSITMASVQAARDKARIGAGLKFASYNYHVIGVDTIAMWDFDTTSLCYAPLTNICVPDMSGNGIMLRPKTQILNYVPILLAPFNAGFVSSITPTNKGKSAKIDSTHYFGHDRGANLSYYISQKDLKPKDFTISAWVYKKSPVNTSGETIASLSSGDGVEGFNVAKIIASSGGGFSCIYNLLSPSTSILNQGVSLEDRWQQVTCSYNGTAGTITLFVDGKQVGNFGPVLYDGSTYDNGGPISDISIGYDIEDTEAVFNGYIDDVVIYGSALVATDVERIYAAGLPEHLVAYEK